ncbi:unnamed protein product [Tilletia laevis]|uniref:Uncharacterized protein n=1 Tax=Tilletia laevis TaxID=157183 RepID=A0A9N8LPE1_9BASI|nr:unnamed protein product [Tilletia laevis]
MGHHYPTAISPLLPKKHYRSVHTLIQSFTKTNGTNARRHQRLVIDRRNEGGSCFSEVIRRIFTTLTERN